MLFGFLWPFYALGVFDVIAVTLLQPFGITFCTPKVEKYTCDVWHLTTSEVYFYIFK